MLAGDPKKMHEANDEMEETHHEDGNETNTSGAGGDGTSGSEATCKRKARRPNQLGTTRESFTEVDPKSGLPTTSYEYAKSYVNQIGCIV